MKKKAAKMAEGGLNVNRSQESISECSGDHESKLQVKTTHKHASSFEHGIFFLTGIYSKTLSRNVSASDIVSNNLFSIISNIFK